MSYNFLDYTNPSTLNTYPPVSQDERCKYLITLLVVGLLPPDTLNYNGTNTIYPNIQLISKNETASLFTVGFDSEYGNHSLSLGVAPWGQINYDYSCKEIDLSKLKAEPNKLFFTEYTSFASFFKLEGLIYPLELSYDQNLYSITNLENFYYLVKFKTASFINSQNYQWRVDINFPGSISVTMFFSNYNESIPKINPNEIVDIQLRPTNQIYSEMGFQYGPLTTFKSTSTALQTQLFFWDMGGILPLMAKPLFGTPGNLTFTVLTFPSISSVNYSLSYPNNNNSFSIGFVNTLSTNIEYGNGIIDGNSSLYHYYENSTLFNIYSGGYFGLKNYSSKYLSYGSQQSNEEIGVSLPFPFGFVWGNNSYYHINVTKLSSFHSVAELTLIFQDKISGQQMKLQNIQPINIVTNFTAPEIKDFQAIGIDKFKFIVSISIKSQWGVKFITIDPLSQKKIIIKHDQLVSGTIYDGVWEFTLNGLVEQYEKITIATLCDTYHSLYFGSLFSINHPSETISLPKTNLKNFNYINDLKDISFLYNNISATNQTISNIMFINFTNINDYKDQIVGLYLIDSKSLRDISYDSSFGAGSDLNEIQQNKYYFAEFDSNKNQFQIRFNIPANTIPGRLDFILSFSNKVHIFSPSLPNNYQLYVYPENIDIQGPVFTSIIKNPENNLGWLITIEDSVNGLDYGVISVFGLSDSSTYNYTIKPSNAVKGDKWKGDYEIYLPFKSNSVCLSQDYMIRFVELFDTQGNSATFIKYMDLSDPIFIRTITNPFIYFYDDPKINTISITCENGILGTDFIPPKLLSFSSSKDQLDVGIINSVNFDFEIVDDLGIKENQFPIVYLSTINYETIQCGSRNMTNFNQSTKFRCSMDIPIGFGYPSGILLSVYGFINNGGAFSGYCSQQLLELNFSHFIATNGTFSIDQPYIKSSNQISNLGGNLWIFGRGFGLNSTAWVRYFDDTGFNQAVITSVYSSSLLIERIKPTNQSFTIVIKTQSTMSNEFIIKPVEFYYNYTAPTSPPLPTNPPKKCLGNPECGGVNNGYCNNGIGCVCYIPWIGEDCTSKVIVVPQPSTNTTNPTIEIPIGGGNDPKETNLYKSLISIVSLRELDFNNKQVKSYSFEKWIYSKINNSTNKYFTTISNKNNIGENADTNITVILQWFEKNDTVIFAGQTLRMNPSSIKYTINITSYSFAQNLNHLQLVMSASLQSSKTDDICSSKSFGNTSDGDNSNFMKLKVNDHSVYGRFIKRAIVDNKIISVENNILDDSMNPSSDSHKSETFIGISIPFYNYNVLVDPDFSIIIDNSPSSSNDENSICTSSSSKLSKVQIAGIIIGSVGFAAVIVISTIYFIRKRKEQQNIINKMKRVSQSVN
ncbi:hypothetical protein ACTFIV_008711 [Dictyostelium citrinum]